MALLSVSLESSKEKNNINYKRTRLEKNISETVIIPISISRPENNIDVHVHVYLCGSDIPWSLLLHSVKVAPQSSQTILEMMAVPTF